MVMKRRGAAWAGIVLVAGMMAWGTETAHACPFCTTAKTGNGYLLATVLLLTVLFVALVGFVLWLRRWAGSPPAAERCREESTGVP
jgi:hypothetical protein